MRARDTQPHYHHLLLLEASNDRSSPIDLNQSASLSPEQQQPTTKRDDDDASRLFPSLLITTQPTINAYHEPTTSLTTVLRLRTPDTFSRKDLHELELCYRTRLKPAVRLFALSSRSLASLASQRQPAASTTSPSLTRSLVRLLVACSCVCGSENAIILLQGREIGYYFFCGILFRLLPRSCFSEVGLSISTEHDHNHTHERDRSRSSISISRPTHTQHSRLSLHTCISFVW